MKFYGFDFMSTAKYQTIITPTTIISGLTLMGMVTSGVWFFYPLKDLPERQAQVSADLYSIQRTQAVQAESLKILADIARETRGTRRDLDRIEAFVKVHQAEHVNTNANMADLKKRVDRIETKVDKRIP